MLSSWEQPLIFPAMVNGNQGMVEQDEGQRAAVWQGRASLGVTWSALCLECASALVAALMRNTSGL